MHSILLFEWLPWCHIKIVSIHIRLQKKIIFHVTRLFHYHTSLWIDIILMEWKLKSLLGFKYILSIFEKHHRSVAIPAGIYLLKVNNRNTRPRCEICSKLTIKTPKRRHWRRSGVFFVNFENISHLLLVLLSLTLNI